MSAALGHLSLNKEDVLSYINAVNDRLLPGIFADHVLIEKGKGALVRCGGQANEEGVEVVQHLLPNVVDGAVALVNDDAVKKLRRILLVVDYLFGRLAVR